MEAEVKPKVFPLVKPSVRLKGLSLKGKNRIREHGQDWDVLIVEDNAILVQSKKDSNYVRWVEKVGDSHMEIVEIPIG